jgi:hypothetical protein
MKLLRRILHWEAGGLIAYGLVAGLAPVWLLETVFDQFPLGEYAWVRMTAITAVGFAALYVLVARRVEELWWFAWAFVLAGGGIALLAAINALFGLPDGESALFWWLLTAGAGLNTMGLLIALARARLEHRPG